MSFYISTRSHMGFSIVSRRYSTVCTVKVLRLNACATQSQTISLTLYLFPSRLPWWISCAREQPDAKIVIDGLFFSPQNDWEAWGRFSDCDNLVLIYNEGCDLKEQIELCLSTIVFYYFYSNRQIDVFFTCIFIFIILFWKN